MTEPKSFSIAVLKGASRGRVVRTEKKRIAVGSAKDNDLVLDDLDILARHFVVLIDQGRWRVHALTADKSVSIGNEWVHPTSGARGAFISTGAAEVLLFPGHLEDEVVQEEISKRERVRDGALPRSPRRVVASAPFESPAMDLLESSLLPTVASEKLPDDLRSAAKSRLQEARGVESRGVEARGVEAPGPKARGLEAPSVARERAVRAPDAPTMLHPRARSGSLAPTISTTLTAIPASSSGLPRRAGDETRTKDKKIPEVVPEPEVARVLRIAAPQDSNVITTPAFDSTPVHKELEAAPASPERSAPNGTPRNAWGDKVDRFAGQGVALRPVATPAAKNAWGDVEPRRPKTDHGASAIMAGRTLDESRGGMASAPAFDRGPPLGMPIALDALSERDEPALAILRDPDGEYATAIRLLGARLEEFVRTLGYRAYMITSPEPLTGKSTVAANLALALAEDTHRRVALIEANFRHPRVAQIFGAPADRGLIPLLDGRAQIGEAAVKVTDRNLVIIPSGGRHPSPAELLAAPRFKALVAELANTVDIAIIDAPSVMPFADTNILLPLVDAALLVVTEGRTEASWMAKARAQIGDSRILGAVYNRISKTKARALRRELKLRMKA